MSAAGPGSHSSSKLIICSSWSFESSASPSRGLGDRTLVNTRVLKVVVLPHWIALFFPRRARVIYVGMEA